jgi:hypothetical protein
MPYRAPDRRLLLRGDQLVAVLACMIHTTYPLRRPTGLRHHQRELLPTAANRAESLYLTRPTGWTDRAGLAQGMHEVPLVPDQGPVEELTAAGLHPSLRDRIHSRHLNPARHNFDARVSEDRAGQARELAIAVPDKEPRPAAGVLKIHD